MSTGQSGSSWLRAERSGYNISIEAQDHSVSILLEVGAAEEIASDLNQLIAEIRQEQITKARSWARS
ncbi:hypothetical protein MA4S0116R_3229 [Mycobacteroides abscessus 4S-0116-R]|uniref:Uncharacterized protein n=1 Tax=Mycobacteroides immunogenum TaxID=83262 RepID=A0A179VIX9_9MYCO|nr:hypothetical protein MA4S0303_3255 [Mycobacteroides abscessus 4S-0303]EIT94999.1 hypothetical protein MA4S0726RA_3189 [Mycobacteroides abscessus 4S-0726-RA]EIV07383.1 hypothetical protein MA4S0206_3273 [Mycobacteroides abscessus 4S-0206]EIV47865.1 hypothetical protein MA4S0116R_3229 [Mycobacteroides abscessus 4S-0116-R]OAT70965.1 hypothetical protein AWB85_06765 [Mycobacteroides immunogenum]RIT61672.1 hypothetical protein D2E90_16820 [Mycobacteroides abscessus]